MCVRGKRGNEREKKGDHDSVSLLIRETGIGRIEDSTMLGTYLFFCPCGIRHGG
jgi:hypothetical protein